MSKKQNKRLRRDLRIATLRSFCLSFGFELRQFTPKHFRIFGHTVVDYWPDTGSCWVVGSFRKASKMDSEEVIVLASQLSGLPEGAEEHLRSIQ
jgi:hypothetical protein